MATSLVQIRIDNELKNEVCAIFEKLGLDLSTAIRMFLKRAVLENGIPFCVTLPREEYTAERAMIAMKEMSESAYKNGLSNMSLNEINAEIEAVRAKNNLQNGVDL